MPKANGSKVAAMREHREALVADAQSRVAGQMTRAEAADLTGRINRAGGILCDLLQEAKDRQAWRALGYDSWREYATAELQISQSRAYQLLGQAKVKAALNAAANSTNVEISEWAARDVAPVLDEVVAEIRERIAAGEDGDEVAAEVVEKRREISTMVEKQVFTTSEPEEGNAPLDFVAELERAARELSDLQALVTSLQSSDVAKELTKLTTKYGQLEGRLNQSMQTEQEARCIASASQRKLADIRKLLRVETDAEIVSCLRDLLR